MSTSTSEDHEYMGRTNVVSASILSPLALPSLSSRGNVAFSVEVDTETGRIDEFSKTGNPDDTSKKHFECYTSRLYVKSTLSGPSAATGRSMLIEVNNKSEEANPNAALATIKRAFVHHFEQYHIHPTYLDTCTQAGSALIYMPAKTSSHVTRVPIGVHACHLQSRLRNPHAWACAIYYRVVT